MIMKNGNMRFALSYLRGASWRDEEIEGSLDWKYYQKDVDFFKKILAHGVSRPQPNTRDHFYVTQNHCLLIGCFVHD